MDLKHVFSQPQKISINGKTVLVIGGAGFLGSYLVQSLARQHYRVAVIDWVNSLPREIKKSVRFYKLDIAGSKIREIFMKEKPGIIYYLAGAINLRRDIADPIFKKSLNILGNLDNILECCVKYRVQKIIFFSSGGTIYEKAKTIPTPEDYPCHPTSLYGLANLIIEKYLENYCQRHNLDFTILRLSNVYGPRQWRTGLIPSLISKIFIGESPVIYSNGKQTRDFIFVDDVIEASILILKKNKNGIYNISSNKEITINEVLNKINTILHKKIKPAYDSSKIEEVPRNCPDNSKIKKELGWKPKTDIDKGLKKTIDWFKSEYIEKPRKRGFLKTNP